MRLNDAGLPDAAANVRAPLDRTARRYYIYRLTSASGEHLYVGRSCEPFARLREHHRTTTWAADVTQIEAWGPYTWDEACRQERARIEADRPRHNRMFILSHTHKDPTLA